MPASVFFPILGFALAACGPQVTDRNIDALNRQFKAAERNGKTVSQKEVEAILGQPTRVEPFPIQMVTTRELPGARYYYEQDGQTVELHFIDDKLLKTVRHFGEKVPDGSGALKMAPRAAKETP